MSDTFHIRRRLATAEAVHPLEQHRRDIVALRFRLDAAHERGRAAAARMLAHGRAAGWPDTRTAMEAACAAIRVTFGGEAEVPALQAAE